VAVPQQDEVDEPAVENPAATQAVHDWIAGRVAADAQMRAAGAARRRAEQEGDG
jgi:hypothetical protein